MKLSPNFTVYFASSFLSIFEHRLDSQIFLIVVFTVSLFLVPQIGMIYIWSYVYNIVRVSSVDSVKGVETSESPTSMSSREEVLFPSEITWTEPLLDSENGAILPHDIPGSSQVFV